MLKIAGRVTLTPRQEDVNVDNEKHWSEMEPGESRVWTEGELMEMFFAMWKAQVDAIKRKQYDPQRDG